jgi:integrase/recombinase XerD
VGEALALQCSDVRLTQDDEKIRVFGKGQRERTVMLTATPQSIRLLRRHLRQSHISSGSVFWGDPRLWGSPLLLDYTVVQKAWQKYCQAAGVQATIHQLRHSRATQLIQAGVPVTTIRKQMGHRNLQSTLLYAEVDQTTIKQNLLEYQRRKGKLS